MSVFRIASSDITVTFAERTEIGVTVPEPLEVPRSGGAHVRLEICVEDADGAIIADGAGADRIELCTALIVGGLTPSIGTVATAMRSISDLGIHVLVRPRPGDFVFDSSEVATMVADIRAIRSAVEELGFLGTARRGGARLGFVVGALTAGGAIDEPVISELVAACEGAPVTFHRAFDLTADLDRSLDTLIDLGFARVLTGGGERRAVDGIPALARLVQRSRADGSDGTARIDVMPGGSVRPENAARILAGTGARDLHLRAATAIPNVAAPRALPMTSGRAPDEEFRERTSESVIAEMIRLSATV